MSQSRRWTPEDVKAFVEREVLGYQKIELPFGFSTPGKDRAKTRDLVFGDSPAGKTVLDVGCSLGYFCLEALKRGATRGVGWDVDPDRVRQAGMIAEMLGSSAEYYHRDIEGVISDEVFNVVMCLNVLHHMRDPIAVLDKLIRMTGETLILEIATPEGPDRDKFGLSVRRSRGIAGLPVILVGESRTLDAAVTPPRFSFTRSAITNLLSAHRNHFARIDVLRSELKDRFIVMAQRRQIDHLVVLAGPMASGKSILIKRIQNGGLPEVGARLRVDDLATWPYAAAHALAKLTTPRLRRLILHYEFTRPYRRRAKTHERDEALGILEAAREVSFVTLWTPPPRLVQQHTAQIKKHSATGAARWAGPLVRRYVPERLLAGLARLPVVGRGVRWLMREPSKRVLDVLRVYHQPDKVVELYDRWFAFCDRHGSRTRDHLVLEHCDGVLKLLTRAEWERQVAGLRDTARSGDTPTPRVESAPLKQHLNRVIAAARRVSPRRRRWERFLKELPLDPERLPRTLESPGERDFIICGSPRSGTTLVSAMLYQPPAAVTVMEPWDGMRLPPGQLFDSVRQEIRDTGRLGRGRLNIDTLMKDGSVQWCQEGAVRPEVRVVPDYVLGIKWPAYWRYLDLLPSMKFLVCLRDPIETIGSYKASGGRLGQGLNYDTAFNRSMNLHLESATRDVALRRILLFDYVHSRILPHLGRPNVFVVRYERWFTEREALLAEIGTFLGVRLGPGRALTRPPRGGSKLSPEEIAQIRAHCATAALLGYALEETAGQTAGRKS